MKREARFISHAELRTTSDGQITGYAAVFNSLSEDLGGFRERIIPGAFRRTIKTADVRALINHDPNLVLGRTSAGTLTLEEDANGLKFACKMPAISYASDLMVSIRRGDISQCSFGFSMVEDRWNGDIRELVDVDLFDVSAVTYPAYPDTSVQARELREKFNVDHVGLYNGSLNLFDMQAYIDGDPIAAALLGKRLHEHAEKVHNYFRQNGGR